ncbi:imelysin family protein [Oligoflexus tunisiensis]|uniref:imelysin family protein n=1 Tax=Oligoflexus tunisiensis TaxID=708132 RepID=UPI00159EFA09|nr:imelysin family protein [Oligoflexus tunisiensis]
MMKKNWTLLLALPFTVAGCGENSSNSPAVEQLPAFDRLGLLKDISEGVIQPRYASFVERTQALKTVTDSFCQNLTTGSAWATAVTPVQNEWKETMALWQEVEAFQFGPLTDQESILRYDIYTWPVLNACAVDRQVNAMAQNAATYSLSTDDGTKSLSAIEYLLYDDDSLHACKADDTQVQGWNDRTEAARHELRCGYLKLLATDLVTQAETLQNKWNDGSQGYHYQLIAEAGDTDLQTRINVISDSLFFLDATLKDKKLGIPLGIHSSCRTDVCPESIEHPLSQQSLAAVQHNLIGFKAAFEAGFDDYLKAAGGEALATQMQTDIDEAVASAESLADESLLDFINNLDQAACAATTTDDRKVAICALYQDVKVITDELKTEFVEILKLSTPAQSSGDND